MRLTVMGCGGAAGVPLVGNNWGDCDPAEPRNVRRRSSILIQQGATTLVVDTGPDLRLQFLDARVERIDAILYTHTHADHTHGIDEMRALNRAQRQAIDAFGTRDVLDHLVKKFDYIFDKPGVFDPSVAFYKPSLVPRAFTWGQAFDCHGVEVLPFAQDHGFMMSTGLRFGEMAYSTDVVRLDDAAFEALKGVKTWVVACLQEDKHPTHAHLARVLEWIERVGPDRAFLTHLSHKTDYQTLSAKLPRGVEAAYDGLVLEGADSIPGTLASVLAS